jgi:hypothetical protein
MNNKLREQAIQLFDSGDQRSFDEIYGDKMDLFEDVEDIIDPRMKKLFEATYQTGNIQQKHLRESTNEIEKLKKDIISQVPKETKEQISELLEQMSLEDALMSLLTAYNISSPDQVESLDEKSQQTLVGHILLICALSDNMEAFDEFYQKGLEAYESGPEELQEAWNDTYSPSYKKYKHGFIPSEEELSADKGVVGRYSGTKYPRIKVENGEGFYFDGERVTPGMKSKIIDKAKSIGLAIGKVGAVAGLIGVFLSCLLVPFGILAHNICRLAFQSGLFGWGSSGPATGWNVAGVIIGALLTFGGGYAKVRTRESGPYDHNFSGEEPGPSGDGVPASHNSSELGGSDPATVQSGQDYNTNPALFESIYKKSLK